MNTTRIIIHISTKLAADILGPNNYPYLVAAGVGLKYSVYADILRDCRKLCDIIDPDNPTENELKQLKDNINILKLESI